MKEYYWDATLIETGEVVGGGCFAESEDEARKQLESYGYYKDIKLEEVQK